MYTCELCKRVVPPKTKAYRIVLETRFRRYPARADVNRVVKEGKVHYTNDPGGQGREIVHEALVCPDCAAHSQGEKLTRAKMMAPG
jgi:hypothetical protein